MAGKAIYAALIRNDGTEVRKLCEGHSEGPFLKLTQRRDSVLQKALYSTQVDLVLKLLDDAKKRWPDTFHEMLRDHVNTGNNNVLHVAATHDSCITAATKILGYALELLTSKNNTQETPIYIAVRYGQLKMFQFLNRKIKLKLESEGGHLSFYKISNQRKSQTILHEAIQKEHFELALHIAKQIPSLICEENRKKMSGLHLLAMNPSAFRKQDWKWLKFVLPSSFRSLSDDDIIHEDATDENLEGAAVESSLTIPWWDEIKNENRRYEAALQLGSILVKKDTTWIVDIDDAYANSSASYGSPSGANSSDKLVKPPTPLILATKYGCLEIARMIMKEHPHTVEQVGKEYGSILHLAIKYQRIEIFNAVMEMEMQTRKLVRLQDQDGNSILHMVALNTRKVKVDNCTKAIPCDCNGSKAEPPKAESSKPELPKTELTKAKLKLLPWDAEVTNDETRSPAFELQDDLVLFKRVERILKTHYHKTLNRDLKTADHLFAEEKEELRKTAQEWMKRTAENCSIVAVLIATVAFAAAYTLTGGTDDKSGSPVLRKETFFVVFTVADVLSLASTLTAVVVFLSILTSSFRFHDFKETLPKRLMMGISCLVFSLTMMMLAFAATIILMIKDNQQWTKTALYAVAFLPVTVLVSTYLPFYVPLMRTLHYTMENLKHKLPKFRAPKPKNL